MAGLAKGGFGQIAEAKTLAPQYLIGGALGACYVSCVIVTVRTLGAGGMVAASIAGQLTMAVILDQYGLLGLDKDPISVMKAISVVLLAAGHAGRSSATERFAAPRRASSRGGAATCLGEVRDLPMATTTTRILSNYVGGRWTESESSELLDVTNPATGEVLASVPLSAAGELDAAVAAARAAFPAWRAVP